MNVLIIGCGRVGSKLASVLDQLGHDVCVVDHDEENFERLSHDFSGYTVAGVPIDQDTLRRAGIEGSDALIAVTENDNMNIMVSQIAQEVFHLDIVLTRIYDSTREEVFSHFNLHTLCPTNLTVDAVCAVLDGAVDHQQMNFGCTTVAYHFLPVPPELEDRPLRDVDAEGLGGILFGVKRGDETTLLASEHQYILRHEDHLIYARVAD